MTIGLIRIVFGKGWILFLPFILFAVLFLFFGKAPRPVQAQVSCDFSATSSTTVDPGGTISFSLTTFSPGTSYVAAIYSPTTDISKTKPLEAKLFVSTTFGQKFTFSFKMDFGQGAHMAAAGPWDGTSDTPIDIQCSGSPIDLYVNLQPAPAPIPGEGGCQITFTGEDATVKSKTIQGETAVTFHAIHLNTVRAYRLEVWLGKKEGGGSLQYSNSVPPGDADGVPNSSTLDFSVTFSGANNIGTPGDYYVYVIEYRTPEQGGNYTCLSDTGTLGEGLKVTVQSGGETCRVESFDDGSTARTITIGEQVGVKISNTVNGDTYIVFAVSQAGGPIVNSESDTGNGGTITISIRVGTLGDFWIRAKHRFAPDRPPRDCSGQLLLVVRESLIPTLPAPSEIKTGLGTIPTEPGRLASGILLWGTGIVGGIAFLMMLYGGFLILTSGGHPENLALGREVFTAAVVGLLFVLFAVWLLRFLGGALPIPGIG